jgi:4,5:9,10-diseco-3-hydroxy-5,9,17-trioxoandrosta-1(10),2-diene-4-oate hydrolase
VESYATVYGNRIRYLDTGGAAKTVVLIHGMGNDTDSWMFNIPALARSHRVVAIDLPGYGKSDKPAVAYRVGLWVDFLDRFLRDLSIERPVLVGASLGGWIAASYALEHPDRVSALVLVSTGGLPRPKEVGEKELRLLNPSTLAATRALMDIVFFDPRFKTEQSLAYVFTKRMTAGDGFTNEMLIGSVLRNEDVIGDRFREIRTPTLLVWGREDRLTPLAMIGEPLSRQIPGARLAVIDGSGHIPYVEQAAKFNDAVNAFLATLP